VLIYTHESLSIREPLIGYLVATAYDIPIIGVSKKEIRDIPILGRIMNFFLTAIQIDRQKNTNTTKYIARELDKIPNFVFAVANDVKSCFINIAENSHADIYVAHFDFEKHIFSVNDVINEIIVQTSSYEKLKLLVENEIKKKYHDVPNTSLINVRRTILLYVPPLVVSFIMFVTLYRFF
jgi:hypothetical protein